MRYSPFSKLLVLFFFLFTTAYCSQEAFRDKKEWFNAFLRATDQKSVLKKTILETLQQKYPHVWQDIQNPQKPFSFLFLGAGNGGIEIPLMQAFLEARGSKENFSIFCEDPSLQMKEEFYGNAEKAGIDSLIEEYNLQLLEDPAYQPKAANFVLASHVWYYINNWKNVPYQENALVKFYELIQAKGVGLITLQSCTSDRYTFLATYADLIGQKHDVCGEDLVAEYDRLAIAHSTTIMEAHTSLESCFQNDIFNPQQEGKNLLSFFLRAPWDDLSPEIQEKLKEKILALVKINGKKEFVFRDAFIWLQHP